MLGRLNSKRTAEESRQHDDLKKFREARLVIERFLTSIPGELNNNGESISRSVIIGYNGGELILEVSSPLMSRKNGLIDEYIYTISVGAEGDTPNRFDVSSVGYFGRRDGDMAALLKDLFDRRDGLIPHLQLFMGEQPTPRYDESWKELLHNR